MTAPRRTRIKATPSAPRKKRPAKPTTEVVITLRIDKAEIENQIAESVVDQLYNKFRGYSNKPKVNITVGGKEVV